MDLQGLYREANRAAPSYNIAALACMARRLWPAMFASLSLPAMNDFTVCRVRKSGGKGCCNMDVSIITSSIEYQCSTHTLVPRQLHGPWRVDLGARGFIVREGRGRT